MSVLETHKQDAADCNIIFPDGYTIFSSSALLCKVSFASEVCPHMCEKDMQVLSSRKKHFFLFLFWVEEYLSKSSVASRESMGKTQHPHIFSRLNNSDVRKIEIFIFLGVTNFSLPAFFFFFVFLFEMRCDLSDRF